MIARLQVSAEKFVFDSKEVRAPFRRADFEQVLGTPSAVRKVEIEDRVITTYRDEGVLFLFSPEGVMLWMSVHFASCEEGIAALRADDPNPFSGTLVLGKYSFRAGLSEGVIEKIERKVKVPGMSFHFNFTDADRASEEIADFERYPGRARVLASCTISPRG